MYIHLEIMVVKLATRLSDNPGGCRRAAPSHCPIRRQPARNSAMAQSFVRRLLSGTALRAIDAPPERSPRAPSPDWYRVGKSESRLKEKPTCRRWRSAFALRLWFDSGKDMLSTACCCLLNHKMAATAVSCFLSGCAFNPLIRRRASAGDPQE